MREIKFRAWDNHDHIIYKQNSEIRMTYYGNPVISDDGWMQLDCLNGCAIGDSGEDRFILMQYTGLKDKNGKEIYEGDIVNVDRHGNTFRGRIDYMPLGCIDAAFHLVKLTPSTINRPPVHPMASEILQNDDEEHYEVIGNIYENPELLKEEK